MKLNGMKTAILADTTSQEYEVWYLLMRLLEEGADVYLVGPKEVQAYSNHNNHFVRMDNRLSLILSSVFDAVIVPGLYQPNWSAKEAAMTTIVDSVLARGGLVAMICDSEWIPISASVFNGREVACRNKLKSTLVSVGAKCSDEEVIRDGNLISACGRKSLEAFSQAIVDHLIITNIGG